jgi:hypothetical protein
MNQRTGDESSAFSVPQRDAVITSHRSNVGPVRVRISEPGLLDDLSDALRRASCQVRRWGEDGIEIGSPSPILTADQARQEIGLYLVLWRAKHPNVRVTVEE